MRGGVDLLVSAFRGNPGAGRDLIAVRVPIGPGENIGEPAEQSVHILAALPLRRASSLRGSGNRLFIESIV